jgi:hypothetical protein
LKGDTAMKQHILTTAPLAQSSSQLPATIGRIKFTPERIEQIRNLVEREKSREEIAALIGVTLGSLQVTCSKLGISLRRRRFDNGIRLRHGGGTRSTRGHASDTQSTVALRRSSERARETQLGAEKQEQVVRPYEEQSVTGSPNFAIRFQYNGMERTTELALTQDAIQQLALEAGLRDVRIGELIGQLIAAMTERNLFQRVLEPA